MSKAINRKNVRDNLPTQNEPHWGPELGEGLYLGFRKTRTGEGSWVSRFQRGKEKRYHTIGKVADVSYNDAKKKAEEWARNPGHAPKRHLTVADACRAYVENQRVVKTEAAARDSDRRFRQLVYGAPLGAVRLDQLTVDDVEKWRNDQAGKKSNNAVNRNMASLKAALNYARGKRWVIDDFAWMTVKPLKADTKPREEYITLQDRKRLQEAADAPLAAILKGYEFTGCRPGELRKVKVSDFDPRTCTLTVRHDKGGDNTTKTRPVPLVGDACDFFKSVRGNRIGDVPLFPDHQGQEWTEGTLNKFFRRTRAKVGLPESVVLYCYRHTHIADCLLNGIDAGTTAKMHGTSITMIEKFYHKYVRTSVQDKLEAIEVS